MIDLENQAYDSRPPRLDEPVWLDDVIARAWPWLALGAAVLGWSLFVVTADRLADMRVQVEIAGRNLRQCAETIHEGHDRIDRMQRRVHTVEDGYVTLVGRLAPLWDRTRPVEMVPVHVENEP